MNEFFSLFSIFVLSISIVALSHQIIRAPLRHDYVRLISLCSVYCQNTEIVLLVFSLGEPSCLPNGFIKENDSRQETVKLLVRDALLTLLSWSE